MTVLITFGSLLGICIGCETTYRADPSSGERAATTPSAAAASFSVAMIQAEDHSVEIEVPGTVEGYEMALLKSRIDGYVGSVAADIGDEVKRDDVLAELDVPEMLADLSRMGKMADKAKSDVVAAQAMLGQAQSQRDEQQAQLRLRQSVLDRLERLLANKAMTQEKVDEARFDVDSVKATVQRIEADIAAAQAHVATAEAAVGVAEAEYAKAEALGGYTRIRAPFDGLITERMVDPGAFVRPATNGGSPLFHIESVERVRIVVYLSMENAGKLNVGDSAVLHGIPGAAGERFEGQITRFAKALQRGSRMMRAEIDLPNPVDESRGRRKLMPGDYGKVAITLDRVGDLATVPAAAIGEDSQGTYVVRVTPEQTGKRQYVDVVLRRKDRVAVIARGSKLTAGQLVLTGDVESVDDHVSVAGRLVTETIGVRR